MRLTRSMLSRATLVGAAAGLLVGALLSPNPATAKAGGETRAADIGAALQASLGDRTAGSYLDASGALVVTVTDEAAAEQVRAAGAEARFVSRSAADLRAVTTQLERDATMPGTAWAVDPVTNQVLVSADATVTGAKYDALAAVVSRFGAAARIERVDGAFSLRISGGDAIFGGNFRCSLGFNVRNSTTFFFLTAGHCTNSASSWYTNSSHTTLIGTRTGTSFPGNDYGIVQYTTSVAHPGTVGSQDITSSGTPAVNQTVTRRGSTTGVHTGRVTALNATVNYPEGTVTGLIRTTVCAEPGDSGGSLYQGTVAYGLTSGGSGNCTTGGTTFFQPVTEVLSRFGVSVF